MGYRVGEDQSRANGTIFTICFQSNFRSLGPKPEVHYPADRPMAAGSLTSMSLKPVDEDFLSDVILIIRLPVRPSRLKAISMPTVLRNVWQRRNRLARARGLLGHPEVLTHTTAPAAIWARRRSEALPAHVARTAIISRTKAATGSASIIPSIAARRFVL